MDDEKSAPKPPPHPPIQAIHPGRRNSRARKMETHQAVRATFLAPGIAEYVRWFRIDDLTFDGVVLQAESAAFFRPDIVRRQPAFDDFRHGQSAPHLLRRRVQFGLEADLVGRIVVVHWSISFSTSFSFSMCSGQKV